MMMSLQIGLFMLGVSFGMGSLLVSKKEDRFRYVSIFMVSVIALTITFFI